jgi:serine/threonine-protein kinase
LDAWTKESSRVRFLPSARWLTAYAATAETKEEADLALREQPKGAFLPVGQRSAFTDAAYGRTLLLGGRAKDAVPYLARAAHMCTALEEPLRHVRAGLWLAEALGATGDTAGACAELGKVVKRWGGAVPRSITAEQAKEDLQAMGCQ